MPSLDAIEEKHGAEVVDCVKDGLKHKFHVALKNASSAQKRKAEGAEKGRVGWTGTGLGIQCSAACDSHTCSCPASAAKVCCWWLQLPAEQAVHLSLCVRACHRHGWQDGRLPRRRWQRPGRPRARHRRGGGGGGGKAWS